MNRAAVGGNRRTHVAAELRWLLAVAALCTALAVAGIGLIVCGVAHLS